MLKLTMLLLISLSTVVHADSYPGIITVKERLRILLWTEGLGKQPILAKHHRNRPYLPEELERPLRKM